MPILPLPFRVLLTRHSQSNFSWIVRRSITRFFRLSTSMFISSLKMTSLHLRLVQFLWSLQNASRCFIWSLVRRGFGHAGLHIRSCSCSTLRTVLGLAVLLFDSVHNWARTVDVCLRSCFTIRIRLRISLAVEILFRPVRCKFWTLLCCWYLLNV